MSVQSLKLGNGGATYITRGENEVFHSIIGFPKSGSSVGQIVNLDDFFVVDMTRMQWGKRGIFGEPYFLGKGRDWQNDMVTICNDMKELGIGASWISENQHTELMRKSAKRAWDRWNDRENVGWCDYCGVGGKLSACAECKKGDKKIWYCGVEHQRKGWKLHKFTGEKKTTANAGKK